MCENCTLGLIISQVNSREPIHVRKLYIEVNQLMANG